VWTERCVLRAHCFELGEHGERIDKARHQLRAEIPSGSTKQSNDFTMQGSADANLPIGLRAPPSVDEAPAHRSQQSTTTPAPRCRRAAAFSSSPQATGMRSGGILAEASDGSAFRPGWILTVDGSRSKMMSEGLSGACRQCGRTTSSQPVGHASPAQAISSEPSLGVILLLGPVEPVSISRPARNADPSDRRSARIPPERQPGLRRDWIFKASLAAGNEGREWWLMRARMAGASSDGTVRRSPLGMFRQKTTAW